MFDTKRRHDLKLQPISRKNIWIYSVSLQNKKSTFIYSNVYVQNWKRVAKRCNSVTLWSRQNFLGDFRFSHCFSVKSWSRFRIYRKLYSLALSKRNSYSVRCPAKVCLHTEATESQLAVVLFLLQALLSCQPNELKTQEPAKNI